MGPQPSQKGLQTPIAGRGWLKIIRGQNASRLLLFVKAHGEGGAGGPNLQKSVGRYPCGCPRPDPAAEQAPQEREAQDNDPADWGGLPGNPITGQGRQERRGVVPHGTHQSGPPSSGGVFLQGLRGPLTDPGPPSEAGQTGPGRVKQAANRRYQPSSEPPLPPLQRRRGWMFAPQEIRGDEVSRRAEPHGVTAILLDGLATPL
ncbi:hypothetical protein NDU88_001984 [Pleurodeles waltl]|uniref:Uncharacterized protein n=1 Tax=Pleurodeles waltl TaxID=8319 RepID=A0AAV7RBF4_PLEWA|nr:hypothetical protein NDU88_001984 [Pleurodeles waltl]